MGRLWLLPLIKAEQSTWLLCSFCYCNLAIGELFVCTTRYQQPWYLRKEELWPRMTSVSSAFCSKSREPQRGNELLQVTLQIRRGTVLHIGGWWEASTKAGRPGAGPLRNGELCCFPCLPKNWVKPWARNLDVGVKSWVFLLAVMY